MFDENDEYLKLPCLHRNKNKQNPDISLLPDKKTIVAKIPIKKIIKYTDFTDFRTQT